MFVELNEKFNTSSTLRSNLSNPHSLLDSYNKNKYFNINSNNKIDNSNSSEKFNKHKYNEKQNTSEVIMSFSHNESAINLNNNVQNITEYDINK